MQNSTLIKQNIQKLVLHHRKTIINEVAQKDLLREAFESNRLPKDLTEEQFLFMLSECLSENGNFILENYFKEKGLTKLQLGGKRTRQTRKKNKKSRKSRKNRKSRV